MNTMVRKIGNSEGVIIPKDMLERLNLKSGDSVEIVEDGNAVRLVPASNDLQEQLAAARKGMAKYRVALRELAK